MPLPALMQCLRVLASLAMSAANAASAHSMNRARPRSWTRAQRSATSSSRRPPLSQGVARRCARSGLSRISSPNGLPRSLQAACSAPVATRGPRCARRRCREPDGRLARVFRPDRCDLLIGQHPQNWLQLDRRRLVVLRRAQAIRSERSDAEEHEAVVPAEEGQLVRVPQVLQGLGRRLAERLRPALVSCSLEPESCARPPAWMSNGHANARMGPAFSSCHLSLGGSNG